MLRIEAIEKARSQVETHQAASANMENNRPINFGSKRDGINNDINLGVTDGFKIRRQSKWL